MSIIPNQQKKSCFIACSEDKVKSGLCDCLNIMRNETSLEEKNILSNSKSNRVKCAKTLI